MNEEARPTRGLSRQEKEIALKSAILSDILYGPASMSFTLREALSALNSVRACRSPK